jgi:hypothetical protein
MSFSWEAYLTLAEVLVRERAALADEEACCRAAISRAYYAAYGATRNYARNREGLVLRQSGQDHHTVLHHYQSSTSSAHRQIGRTFADYEDHLIRPVALAMASLQQARQIFTVLSRLVV